ncbi:MAG TPA: hypothetical protein VFT30_03020 [Nitrospira sp.]|nr:hypothetical protein [Nitrospira sp.]
MDSKPPEGTRVVYVGEPRDDIKEIFGTVVLDAKDARSRSVVAFDDGVQMSIHISDLTTQVQYEADQHPLSGLGSTEEIMEGITVSESEEVDPFAFRIWLIENGMVTEEQCDLDWINKLFGEFRIFLKEDE